MVKKAPKLVELEIVETDGDNVERKLTNFHLPYGDLLLNNAPMMALITAAMDGEFKHLDPEAAFADLTKAQQKYFSKLVIKIYTKAKEKEARDQITERMREVVSDENNDHTESMSEAVAEMMHEEDDESEGKE